MRRIRNDFDQMFAIPDDWIYSRLLYGSNPGDYGRGGWVMGVIAYFVGWAVGCVTMMLVWYFSDIEDHSPYRRGYRDALFDMMKDHVLAREMARRIERETREAGDEDECEDWEDEEE